MKYFIDTEFIEDFHKPLFGKRRHYIDLISIAIVAEDGREYYAVSNEFDLNKVWNKHTIEKNPYDFTGRTTYKDFWLRNNVLRAVWGDLYEKEGTHGKTYHPNLIDFSRKGLRNLIRWHGKSNKQIAEEILHFIWPPAQGTSLSYEEFREKVYQKPEFYGYYADYDWVLFCSLFGRMIDLPSGFPMYCRDLKQMLDEFSSKYFPQYSSPSDYVKEFASYPKQSNTHHALDDARWNKKLYDFIQSQI